MEGNTSKPLLALVASAEGSLSNWSSEVCMCVYFCVWYSKAYNMIYVLCYVIIISPLGWDTQVTFTWDVYRETQGVYYNDPFSVFLL